MWLKWLKNIDINVNKILQIDFTDYRLSYLTKNLNAITTRAATHVVLRSWQIIVQ